MDILKKTGIQLKNDYLIQNGYKSDNHIKELLLSQLSSLKGKVIELTNTLLTLNKETNLYRSASSNCYIFNDEKEIVSILYLNETSQVGKKIDYSSFKDNMISRVTTYYETGEEFEVSTYEYDEFYNILKTEKKSLNSSESTQYSFRKISYKNFSKYIYTNNNELRLYRNGRLIKTQSNGAHQSETINFFYSNDGQLIKILKKIKRQFDIERVVTYYNEQNDKTEIKIQWINREDKSESIHNEQFKYHENGNLESRYVTQTNDLEIYQYNSEGYLTEIWEYCAKRENNLLAVLKYDERNNLILFDHLQNSWKWEISYEYDEFGNWIKRITTHNGHKEIEIRNIKYAKKKS
ncbi:MAG: hypothetical protein HYR91_07445 [Flavobacteriia bacterium]|nr:hypothetical protein [Flavobacteriia bacterium]